MKSGVKSSGVDFLGIANPTASVTVNGNAPYRKGEYFDYALVIGNTRAPQYPSVTVSSTYPPGQGKSGNVHVPKTPERYYSAVCCKLEQVEAPLSATVDPVGKVARGACLLASCLNPCQKWKQIQADQDRYVDAGAIVCCGGIKFVCTWAAEDEKNARAKEILKRCIGGHERKHLPRTTCPDCDCGVGPVKQRGGELCEEELADHILTKQCYEAALAECDGDTDCTKRINDEITAEAVKITFYRAKCNERTK